MEDFKPEDSDISPLSMDDIANYLSQQADNLIRNGADPKVVGAALQERMQKAEQVYSQYGPDVFGPKSKYYNKPDVAGLEGIYSSPNEPGIYGNSASLSDPSLVRGSNTSNLITDPLSSVKDWRGKLPDMDGSTPDAGGFWHTTGDVATQALMNYTPVGLIPSMMGGAAGLGELATTGDINKAVDAVQSVSDTLTPTAKTSAGEAVGQPIKEALSGLTEAATPYFTSSAKAFGVKNPTEVGQFLGETVPMAGLMAEGGIEAAKGFKTKMPVIKPIEEPSEPTLGPKIEIPKTGDPIVDEGMKDASDIYRMPIQEDLFDQGGENATRDMFSGEMQDASIAERDRALAQQSSIFNDDNQRLPSEDEANQDLYRNQSLVPGMPLTRRFAMHEQTPPVADAAMEQGQLPLEDTQGQLNLQRQQEPVVTRGDITARQQPIQQAPTEALKPSEVPQVEPTAIANVTMADVAGQRGLFSPDRAGNEQLSGTIWNALDSGQLTGQHVLDSVADNHDNLYGAKTVDGEARSFADALRQRATQMGQGLDTPIYVADPIKHANLIDRIQKQNIAEGKDPNNWGGFYDPVTKQILINGERNMLPSTLIHEVAHAVTHQAISLGDEGKLTGPALGAYNSLKALFTHIKDNNPELAKQYGFNDLHEMMAEMYGSDAFREALKGYKLDTLAQAKIGMPRTTVGYIRNAYQAMVKGVKNLLGMGLNPKAENALDALFSQSKDFLDKFDKRDAEPSKIVGKAAVDYTFNAKRQKQLFQERMWKQSAEDEFGEGNMPSIEEMSAKDPVMSQTMDIIDHIDKNLSTFGKAAATNELTRFERGLYTEKELLDKLNDIVARYPEKGKFAPNRTTYEAGLSPRRAIQNLDETRRGEENLVKELGSNAAESIRKAALKEGASNQNIREYIENGNQAALSNYPNTKAAVDKYQSDTRVPLAAQGAREQLKAGNQKAANTAFARAAGNLDSAYQGPKFSRQIFKLAETGDKIQAGGGKLSPEHVDAMQRRDALNNYAASKLYPQGIPPTPEAAKAIDQMSKQLVGLRDTIFTNVPGFKYSGMIQDLSGKNANFVRNVLANGSLGRGFQIPAEVAAALGKTEDAVANVLNTTLRQGLDITRTRFQSLVKDAGLEGGWAWDSLEKAPRGSVQLTGSHWGPLEDMYVSRATKGALQKIREANTSAQEIVDGMMKPQSAGAITKAIFGTALDSWMNTVQGLKGYRLASDFGYFTMYLLGSFGKLTSAGNISPSTMLRGIKETFREFQSGVTGADHQELMRNGLIDYGATNILRRKIAKGQFSNDLEMNPIRASLEGMGAKDKIYNGATRIEAMLGAMDYWATKANYFMRKEQLEGFYKRQGIDKPSAEIEREAADQTKQTNTAPGRGFGVTRALEKSGASISLPYVVELHRNIFNSAKLGLQDLGRAYDAKDLAFGLQAVKRLAGTATAVLAGNYVYQQLGQLWANSLGVSSTPIAEDDKRTPYLQDEDSRFRAGQASQLQDPSTQADKDNVYMWDPGGAWDQFYAVSQELKGIGELVGHWDDPNYDFHKQLGRIGDNFSAIILTNNVSRTANKILQGSPSALSKRDPETYANQMAFLQNNAGLSEANANRLENVKDILTPGVVRKYQQTKGLSTGMQTLSQLGYGVTKMPADAGLGGYETTKFNNSVEAARTSVTKMVHDSVDYSDSTMERRYVEALKKTNDALQLLRDAADFGRGNNVDETDLSINARAKGMNVKAAGSLGDIPAAEMLYRNVAGSIENQAILNRTDDTKQSKYTDLAIKKLNTFQELTEKYLDMTPKEIKEL